MGCETEKKELNCVFLFLWLHNEHTSTKKTSYKAENLQNYTSCFLLKGGFCMLWCSHTHEHICDECPRHKYKIKADSWDSNSEKTWICNPEIYILMQSCCHAATTMLPLIISLAYKVSLGFYTFPSLFHSQRLTTNARSPAWKLWTTKIGSHDGPHKPSYLWCSSHIVILSRKAKLVPKVPLLWQLQWKFGNVPWKKHFGGPFGIIMQSLWSWPPSYSFTSYCCGSFSGHCGFVQLWDIDFTQHKG